MSFLILNGLLSLYSSQNSVITKWSSFKMRMRTTELTVLSHKFAIADPDPQPWPYPYLIVRILRRNEDSDLILFFKLWFIKSNFMPIYLIWIFFFHFELRSDLEPDPIIFLSWARSGEQNFGSLPLLRKRVWLRLILTMMSWDTIQCCLIRIRNT